MTELTVKDILRSLVERASLVVEDLKNTVECIEKYGLTLEAKNCILNRIEERITTEKFKET